MLETVAFKTLRHSPRNVRKKKSSNASIRALAANIDAVGLLENLVVSRNDDGTFAVEAGERRLSALQLLRDQGTISDDYPVPVRIIASDAVAASLAENFLNEPMHPVDEFEAFSALQRNEKMEPQQMAVVFGQSERYILQRLRLGLLHPTLRSACRQGAMTMDCLEAFTLCDDKQRQKALWEHLRGTRFTARDIRRALSEGALPSSHKLALFVGQKRYQKAGGALSEDLFDSVSYFENAHLLVELAEQKLAAEAEKHAGWKWVKTNLDTDWSFYHQCDRVPRQDTAESHALQAKYDALNQEYDRLDALPYDDITPQQQERLEALEEQLQQLEDLVEEAKAVSAEDQAISGCYLTIRDDGSLEVISGLVSPEDVKARRKTHSLQVTADSVDADSPKPLFSQGLLSDLNCYRLAAVKQHLAQSFDCAFDVMLVSLLSSLCRIELSCFNGSPIDARFHDTYEDTTRKDLKNMGVVEAQEQLKHQLLSELPRGVDDQSLFSAVESLPMETKQSLFSVLVSQMLVKPSQQGGLFGRIEQ